MKIFTSQLLHLDADEYLSSYYIDFIFAFLIFIVGLVGYAITYLNIKLVILAIPFLILCLFIIISMIHKGCLKIYAQKTHPIYQFIKNQTIANKVYYDAAYLFQSYCQSNTLNNAKLMLNSLDDSNSLLLQPLDEQIYNALQEHSNGNDFDLSNFPIYQKLFMAIVSPLEVRKLNDKLTQIEKDFAYVENNLSPKQFLNMIEKYKKMMSIHFKHDEYNEYKQWHMFANHKIYSVVDKKEPN